MKKKTRIGCPMRVLVHQFSGGQLLAGLLLVSLGFLLVLVTVVMVVLVPFGRRLAAFAVLATALGGWLAALAVLAAALGGWLAALAVLATALGGRLAAFAVLATALLFGVGLLLTIGVGRPCRREGNKSDHAHKPNKTRLHKMSSFSSD
jgi:hypothetical protein